MTTLAAALTDALSTTTGDLVVFTDGRWDRHPWQQVLQRARNVADRLLDDGTAAVGIVGEPTVELIAAVVGGLLAGTPVALLPGPVRGADPASWAQSTAERAAAVGATQLFGNGACLDHLRAAHPGAAVADVAEVAHPRRSATAPLPVVTAVTAVLQGTAGSTGTPRTVALSPAAVLANLRGIGRRVELSSADIGCSWLPLYHDMGLSFLLSAALGGREVWQAPTSAFQASPFRWLHWLSESRATMTAGPNMAYGLLGKYSRRVTDIDLGALRFVLNGGEPIDQELTGRFASEMARFGFSAGALAPSYGLAESVCAVTVTAPGDGLRTDGHGRALLGEPVDGMALRIDPDPDGGDGEVGQISIRGTSMMSGYLGDRPRDPDQWFPTGDLGYLCDGQLVVCGRAKELITIAGRNVFPAEVENAAAQVSGVREGAVAAVGVGEGSVRPGLVVVAEFRGPDEAAARAAVTQRVATACGIVPSDVVLARPGSLPRTSSGKLRRLEIRRGLRDGGRS